MSVLLSLILIVAIVIGFLYIIKIKNLKNKEMSFVLVAMSVAGLVTAFSGVIIMMIGDNYKLSLIGFALYYSGYLATMFLFLWFAYLYTDNSFVFYKSPFFYLSLITFVLMFYNVHTQIVFTTEYLLVGSDKYWIESGEFLLPLFTIIVFLESLIGMIFCVRKFFKCATIFRSRYLAFVIVIVSQWLLVFMCDFFKMPIFVKCLSIIPEEIFYIYMTVSFSPKVFKDNALLFAVENNNDGLVLYDEYDHLSFINARLNNLLDETLISSFEDKKAFDEWANDLVVKNDVFVKHLVIDSNDYFFNVYSHEFIENRCYVGICYTLHDITASIERVSAVEQANEELVQAAHMKSDFLANMSHEIRTPMNAVIGMAEMALREEMTDSAREYITQIKSSGRNLLNIINDILDFSKIESGKMDIIPDAYEPLSEFNDVANTLITRIGDKDIELTLEENPNMPCKLEGDVLRIRQVLINLANNAIKFTSHGRVQIICDYKKISDDEIMVSFHVTDTGMGIKKADLQKIFVSFQQVDSKRNRSIEGTGLGLAISKSLIEAMGGHVGVESEYGKGSDFYFELPQKVLDWSPSVTIDNPKDIFAFGMFSKKYLARRFFIDTNMMGVFSSALKDYTSFDYNCETYADVLPDKNKFLFFEEENYRNQFEEVLKKHTDVIGVMLVNFNSNFKPDLPNLRVIRKPFSTVAIALALNNKEIHFNAEDGKAYEIDFTAPEAKVLIVDDNPVNLTVAEGLLQPLQMKTYTATSGKAAIDLVTNNTFDIIYMDHMMPEMDGVETTHVIRRMFPAYKDIPIIALTANAINGAKEFFIKEGMNDFVAKPVEVRDIMSKTRQWLPAEKIIKSRRVVSVNSEAEDVPQIEGLDCKAAIKLIGTKDLFVKILKEYYKNILSNHEELKECYSNEDWEKYTIKVHALKSSSKQIGAMILSEKALALENAGHENNIEFIKSNTDEALDMYYDLYPILKEYFGDEEDAAGSQEKEAAGTEVLIELMNRMKTACEDLDMDEMEAISEQLGGYSYEDSISEDIAKLIRSAEIMDVDTCTEIADDIISKNS